MKIDVYDLVSPLDYRYYGEDKELFAQLSPFVSEGANVKYMARVEATLVNILARKGICTAEVAQAVQQACEEVSPAEVYAEERIIAHNIRALVNCIKRRLPEAARPYVHLFATSADIMDTATAMRARGLMQQVILPQLYQLIRLLIQLARAEKATPQIGRTHGQYAVPITCGFALAEYVSRLGGRIKAIINATNNLRGQFSGAVGAYNTLALVTKDYNTSPQEIEAEILAELGLKPATHSTQIVEPESLTDLAVAIVSTFSVLANLADDVRHLQRSEIGEIREKSPPERVGSSTMPHKVNPKDFENVKSMWKEFLPRIITVFMDQISEHQRDLTNSASSRFIWELFTGFTCAVSRLEKAMQNIAVDRERMSANLENAAGNFIAEALYILLAIKGHPDPYEHVRHLAYQSRQQQIALSQLIWQDKQLEPYLNQLTPTQRIVLETPNSYNGVATEKTEQICFFWEQELGL